MPPRPERILIRGVNWLGDAVMTTPALARLREAKPQAHLTLLTPEKLSDLWIRHSVLDECLTFAPHESAWSVGRRLREGRFDVGLALPNSFRSALELWGAKIPRRIGYGGQWRRWLLTERLAPRPGTLRMRKRTPSEIRRLVESLPDARGHTLVNETEEPTRAGAESPSPHQIHHYLHLVGALGAKTGPLPPQLSVGEDEVVDCTTKFGLGEPLATPLLFGLNPGAEYGPAKRWPEAYFVEVATAIRAVTGCVWVVLGGKADTGVADRITKEVLRISEPTGDQTTLPAALNLAGRTTLRDLCAVLRRCRMLLTNDSGPMHVAAAVGTPVVTPFGSTSAALTGPGQPGAGPHRLLQSNVPCSPCFLRECPVDLRCLQRITPAHVVEQILALNQSLPPRQALSGPKR